MLNLEQAEKVKLKEVESESNNLAGEEMSKVDQEIKSKTTLARIEKGGLCPGDANTDGESAGTEIELRDYMLTRYRERRIIVSPKRLMEVVMVDYSLNIAEETDATMLTFY